MSAVPVAKTLAPLMRATIHFAYVAHEVTPAAEALKALGLEPHQLRGSVLSTDTGEPAEGILHLAHELQCALIVLCTHTAAERTDKILGSTALGVVRDAICPVILVPPIRGITPWSLHRILLPHDGTPTTSAAIRPAAELALLAKAELDVLHVASSHTHPPAERGTLTLRYMDQPQHEWPDWAAEFLERLRCVCPLGALRVRMSLAQGEPGEEVLAYTARHETDLIVLAWRGEWEPERALTAKTIIHHATFPVMIVRAAS